LNTAVAHGTPSPYLIPAADFSLLSLSFSPAQPPRPNKPAIFSVSFPPVNNLVGHSPLRACDQKISADGPSNHPRFFPRFSSLLPFLVNSLNALEIIFHPTNINQPVTARFPTPHHICFCSGLIFV
jgi:hypothetical protein